MIRFTLLLAALAVEASAQLPAGIRFHQGVVNSVLVGADTAVYGAPSPVRRVLLTDTRRDTQAIPAGAAVIAPAADRELLSAPEKFWTSMETARFHDYAQAGTKVPVNAVKITQAVSDGDVLDGHIRVISTPGYTKGAVTYLIEAGGKRIACTGNLIYGDGQIFDLYSLQDAIPEAKARGYHGYMARAGELIASLRKVAAAKPDLILPARGPMITDPQRSIQRLVTRLQAFMQSHFETDALRWYWGDDNHRIRSRAVEHAMEIMPMAEQTKLPADILAIGNSRVILSKSGAAFLVDAGYRRTLPELERLQHEGKIRSVDGIWITHYHDDHTDYVNDVVDKFHTPVYFTRSMSEILANPAGYRMPCLTTRPIPVVNAKRDGETLRWHEWQFTFWNFPGQTLYHGGLLARRDDGQSYLFVGDSFTPSGMDDYCMQNRDLLRKGEGYDRCLNRIAGLPKGTWLMNQHVEPMFRYTPEQVRRMQDELAKRSAVLRDLSPWPDINYMVDESWARIYPYGSETQAGREVDLELRITNHAPSRMTYKVSWHPPVGVTFVTGSNSVALGAHEEGSVRAKFRGVAPGLHVITANVAFGQHELKDWAEALIRVGNRN